MAREDEYKYNNRPAYAEPITTGAVVRELFGARPGNQELQGGSDPATATPMTPTRSMVQPTQQRLERNEYVPGKTYITPGPDTGQPPVRNPNLTSMFRGDVGTPLLTNRGEGGPRVDYPNDYTRQAYSTPDKNLGSYIANLPTAQQYAEQRLGPGNTQEIGTTKLSDRGSFTSYRDASGAEVNFPNQFNDGAAGGTFTYMRPGQNLDPRTQPPPEPQRPASSFEDIALSAARNAAEKLAPKISYHASRNGRGQTVMVRDPAVQEQVDPGRIYGDTMRELGRGVPSGDARLQAEVSRDSQAANERRYDRQEEGDNARARLAADTSRYSADRGYEAATARNETVKEREQRLSDSPEDKAFIEMQKEEFKYLSPEDKAKLGSNPREQWLSYIGKNMSGAKSEGAAQPVRRQLKSGEWVDVIKDPSGNWVPVGGR